MSDAWGCALESSDKGALFTVLLLFNLLDYETWEEHEVSGGKRCTTHLPGQEAEVGHSGEALSYRW